MQHSSRRNPCPVCGRNKDDKCRWSSTRIYCFIGDSFSPPLDLRIGDKIKIAGELWKLFSCGSGFAQNSYAFAIYDGESYKFLNYEDKRDFRKNCIRLSRLFLQMEKSVLSDSLKIEGPEGYHLMDLDSFRKNKKKVANLLARFRDLADFAFANKRYLIDTGIDIEQTRAMIEKMNATLRFIYDYELLHFDQPDEAPLAPLA